MGLAFGRKAQLYAPMHAAPAVHDVSAHGIRIRFHEMGSGKPLVLIHGFLANRHTWDDVLGRLAADFRVVAIDLPGFGESEKPNPSKFKYDFDAFAESVLDVTAALGLSRVSVGGHGLGGSIALALAARHPSVVENLVLVDPLVYPSRHGLLLEASALPLVGRLAFKQLYGRSAFHNFFEFYGQESTAPRERIDQMFSQFGSPAARESAHATLMTMLDTRSLVAMLPRIQARTLVMWGREDEKSPVAHARNLSRQLTSARLEILSCGHFPHEEKPDEFCATLREFLAPQTPKPRPAAPRGRRA